MINQESILIQKSRRPSPIKIGTISYLLVFLWSLSIILLVPGRSILLAGGFCLLAAIILHPQSYLRIMRLRWLVMIILLAVPPIFILGDIDRSLWGIPYSSEGLTASMEIFVRIIVVLISVDGFTNSVDISSIAGLFERVGFRGLGFTMGVALNLLPSMQNAAVNTWNSLWMRGGMRKQRWLGIRLLFVTIITNALNRTEQIALAADGRAFCAAQCRPMPLKKGSQDILVAGAIILATALLFILI